MVMVMLCVGGDVCEYVCVWWRCVAVCFPLFNFFFFFFFFFAWCCFVVILCVVYNFPAYVRVLLFPCESGKMQWRLEAFGDRRGGGGGEAQKEKKKKKRPANEERQLSLYIFLSVKCFIQLHRAVILLSKWCF